MIPEENNIQWSDLPVEDKHGVEWHFGVSSADSEPVFIAVNDRDESFRFTSKALREVDGEMLYSDFHLDAQLAGQDSQGIDREMVDYMLTTFQLLSADKDIPVDYVALSLMEEQIKAELPEAAREKYLAEQDAFSSWVEAKSDEVAMAAGDGVFELLQGEAARQAVEQRPLDREEMDAEVRKARQSFEEEATGLLKKAALSEAHGFTVYSEVTDEKNDRNWVVGHEKQGDENVFIVKDANSAERWELTHLSVNRDGQGQYQIKVQNLSPPEGLGAGSHGMPASPFDDILAASRLARQLQEVAKQEGIEGVNGSVVTLPEFRQEANKQQAEALEHMDSNPLSKVGEDIDSTYVQLLKGEIQPVPESEQPDAERDTSFADRILDAVSNNQRAKILEQGMAVSGQAEALLAHRAEMTANGEQPLTPDAEPASSDFNLGLTDTEGVQKAQRYYAEKAKESSQGRSR